jgi:hypothetical protein
MQMLLDHLASVAIAGLILLSILALQMRGKDASIEATQFYDSKIRLLSIAEVIERDFSNIGSGVDSVQYAITSLDTVSVPARFIFQARTDTLDKAAHTLIYEWEPTGSVALSDTTYSTYTVKRIINGAISGTNVGSITSLSIKLFNEAGIEITTNYADTRRLNVRVKTISTLGVNSEVELSGWNKNFRPMNLTRDRF